MSDNILIDVSTTLENVNVEVLEASAASIGIEYFYPQGPAGPSIWGVITGTLSSQTDLWSYLSAETFSPSQLTAFLNTNAISLCSINVSGSILSAGTDLFDIFLTSETDSQILNYNTQTETLSISNGNAVSLSSLNNKNYVNTNFLPLSGGTISGSLYVLSSLYVLGSAFYVTAEDLIIKDPIIYIAEDNQTDSLDIGIMASWTNPPGYPIGYQHGGLIRRSDNKVWTLFSGASSEPLSGLNVEWSQQGILLEPLSAKFYGDIYGNRNVYGSLSSIGPVYGSNLNIESWNSALIPGVCYVISPSGTISFSVSADTNIDRGLVLQRAITTAVSGDLILVPAGTYDTTNILKDGVNYHFFAGAKINHTGVTNTPIFTSPVGGNINCKVGGFGTFVNNSGDVVSLKTGDTLFLEAAEIISTFNRAHINYGGQIYITAERIASLDGVLDIVSGTSHVNAKRLESLGAGYVSENDGGTLHITADYIYSAGDPIWLANGSTTYIRDCYITGGGTETILVDGNLNDILYITDCVINSTNPGAIDIYNGFKVYASNVRRADNTSLVTAGLSTITWDYSLSFNEATKELSLLPSNSISLSSLDQGTDLSTVTDYLSTNIILLSGATITTDLSAQGLIYSRSILPELPVPKILLKNGFTNIQYLSCLRTGNDTTDELGIGGNINLYTPPTLLVTDLTNETLSAYQIFIEMVIFKRLKHSQGAYQGKTYVVPSGQGSKPWGNFWNRSGSIGLYLESLGTVRFNQLPVTSTNQRIDLSPCLNTHFSEKKVQYADATDGTVKQIDLICPTKSKSASSILTTPYGRYGYETTYKPLYVAFRYIAWLPENNNGRGQIISGPLSPTIRIANNTFPFHINSYQSSVYGYPVVDLNTGDYPGSKHVFRCKFAR